MSFSMRLAIVCFVLSVVCSTSDTVRADPLVKIKSRNQSIRAILLKPTGALKGAVILFAGDNGRLDIQPDGTIRFLKNNFLMRARALFARAGYATLVPDLAQDMKQGDTEAVDGYRETQNYAEDVDQMVRYMRRLGAGKVWPISTSRGTLSVANYISRHWIPRERTDPDGQIYTSGFWKLSDEELTIWRLANHSAVRLKVPTLLVVHRQDACEDTNPADLDAFTTWLRSVGNEPSVQMFSGGKPPLDGPCQARSQHGFYGLDKEVVKRMTGWIGQHN